MTFTVQIHDHRTYSLTNIEHEDMAMLRTALKRYLQTEGAKPPELADVMGIQRVSNLYEILKAVADDERREYRARQARCRCAARRWVRGEPAEEAAA